YLKAVLERRQHPVVDTGGVRGPKVLQWPTMPAFGVGTSVGVRYPRVTSVKLYSAIVLDYNANLAKPYMVKYSKGGQIDYVIPKRIVLEEDIADSSEGLYNGDAAATPPPQEETGGGEGEERGEGEEGWGEGGGLGGVGGAGGVVGKVAGAAPTHDLFNMLGAFAPAE
ncbi:hypothetical protein TeGR_g6038, partial [Tetraparma gracilis]